MKKSPLVAAAIPNRTRPSAGNSSGFALVIVLGIVVLVAAIAVGLLSRASTERTASAGNRASTIARQLADNAVSFVQGQINIATNQGSQVTWTSQPGMVRTFDSTGAQVNIYKLYSAANLVDTDAQVKGGKSIDAPTTTWADNAALYTDLNAPVDVGTTLNYPILDPGPGSGGGSFPGADADETNNVLAKGFTVDKDNVPVVDGKRQPVPMPVLWLYQLKDGTLVAPADNSNNTVKIDGENKDNPVIGRVAFWTDDESCKVNINTAAGGAYWDVPRTMANQEKNFGSYQPAQREYQRYPGHPAMASLKAVLPDTLTDSQIYSLVPRTKDAGSKGGTVASAAAITFKTEDNKRLYASVDELIFDPARKANTANLTKAQLEQMKFFLTAHSRAPETNLFNLPRVAIWPIYRGTMPGGTATNATTFDQLIALCASTGDPLDSKKFLPYYFQRELADSPTNDLDPNRMQRNVELYNYLCHLTGEPIPGFGGNFESKYGNDREQILTEIFDYIRCTNLFDDVVAQKKGKPFTDARSTSDNTKLQTGHGWVAPIHYTVNGVETMGFGRTNSLSEFVIGFICNADGNDTSATSVNTNDPATNVVLKSANGNHTLASGTKMVQAILAPEFFCPAQGWSAMAPDMIMEISGLNTLSVNGQPLFPAGTSKGQVSYIYQAGSFDSAGLDLYHGRYSGGNPGWRYFGMGKIAPPRKGLSDAPSGKATEIYPFISDPIVITPTPAQTMDFSGGTLTVKLYWRGNGTIDDKNLLQILNIDLPAHATLPVPNIVRTGTNAVSKNNSKATTPSNWWSFLRNGGRLGGISDQPGNPYNGGTSVSAPASGAFFREEEAAPPFTRLDVVRSVLPVHGDYRLAAATYNVPVTAFGKHPNYDSSAIGMNGHSGGTTASLANSVTSYSEPGFDYEGRYNPTANWKTNRLPDMPSNPPKGQTPEISGDFDTGMADNIDGPYINKPDEGNTFQNGSSPPYFVANQQGPSGPTFFSPNRQVPSPGMFGSLPTGVKAGKPWQTLLFRNQPSHPQSKRSRPDQPQDHLIMDLFWMPVVEPYAISDRFSTAGKVNMNYQILPFTYLSRPTALKALFKNEMVAALKNSDGQTYKQSGAANFRYPINEPATLEQFATRFQDGHVFVSASEICDLHIVPVAPGASVGNMDSSFWTDYSLTGDNLRERIYTTLYPRLTTRSNTFTVHFRAQSLKKARTSDAPDGIWSENSGTITGEYRGSTTIERFINAGKAGIPDYAKNPDVSDTLDAYYKWRVVENRQFAP